MFLRYYRKKIHFFLLGTFAVLVFLQLRLDEIRTNKIKQLNVIEELWKDIFSISEDQLLVKKETLIKTIQYMIQEIDEEDPKLISFVKSLITEPADHSKLNLVNKNRNMIKINEKFVHFRKLKNNY